MAGPFKTKPPGLITSPLAVVPKKQPNTWRLIHDLSFPRSNSINSNIPREFCQVKYETLDDIVCMIAKLGRYTQVAKADLRDAFRILEVNKHHYKYLGIFWDKSFWVDKCLPMGSSVSCSEFEELTTAIQWILQNKFGVKNMSHILDDFMFLGSPGTRECHYALQSFLAIAPSLGIPVKHSKTVQPTTLVELHGIQVCTRTMMLSLPPDKLRKALDLVKGLYQLRSVTVAKLQSILGYLNFCTKIVPAGRPFLRRLYDLIKGDQPKWFSVRLTRDIKDDLLVWKEFLTSYNGRTIISRQVWCDQPRVEIFSDACGRGFSGILQNHWFFGIFPKDWDGINIAIKEFIPVYVAFKLWHDRFINSSFLFRVDNESVVYNIKTQTSQVPEILSLLRIMVLSAMRNNVQFFSLHIPGEQNKIADAISRFQFRRARQLAPYLDPLPTPYPQDWLPWNQLQSI